MKAEIYNQENEKVGIVDLPAVVFNVKWNPELVHQVLVAQLANRRKPSAHTKTRGEVRGGGRKPWRQKGTGHARHGSIRSPLWVGGGVTFGPRKEKVYAKKVNRKMKKLALFSIFSKKLAAEEMKIVDDLLIKERKTKKVVSILKNFFNPVRSRTAKGTAPAALGRSASNGVKKLPTVTFVISKANKNFSLAARNIPSMISMKPESLDLYGLLTHKYVFIEKAAIEEIVNHYKL